MGLREDIARGAWSAIGAFGGVAHDIAANALKKADVGESEREPEKDTEANSPVPTEPPKEDPKTLFFDPFALVEQMGYKDRPSSISYDTLRSMSVRMPIVQAIIGERIEQVASFAQVQHDRYQIGFKVKLKDAEKKPTVADKKWCSQMETLITRTGVTDNPRGRDDFRTFLKKITRDSLLYDQMCFEVVPNKKGQPAEWYATDASTMRLADRSTTYLHSNDPKEIRYVQIYDSMIIAEYTHEEMCFGVRNPHTDLRLQGYGVSELENLIGTITALLYAFQYNSKFFSQGSAAKGIINFKGTMNERALQSFRRHWYTMVSGSENQWKTPITNSEDLQYINLQSTNREMEFSAWFDFLIKICSSHYHMDPSEINFQYGNIGQSSTLKESSNKEKLTQSKERGLRPLLKFIEAQINKYIIWPTNEAFSFEFVGLDAATQDDVIERNTKRIKSIITIDEARAEDDLPPLSDGRGDIILDPTFLQNVQGQQAQEEGGEEGMEGEDDSDSDDDDYESMLAQYEANNKDNDDDEEKEPKSKIGDISKSQKWTLEI